VQFAWFVAGHISYVYAPYCCKLAGQREGFGQNVPPLTVKVMLSTAVNVEQIPASFIQVPAKLYALGMGQPGVNLIDMPAGHAAKLHWLLVLFQVVIPPMVNDAGQSEVLVGVPLLHVGA